MLVSMSIIYHSNHLFWWKPIAAMGGSPSSLDGLFMMEKPFKKWMRTRVTPMT